MLRARPLTAALALLAAAGTSAVGEAPGDAVRGEALFTGATRFAGGGSPCLACHGIAGHGLARAASFGPDLSGVYAGYGPEALDGTLTDLPFPSMAPLYAQRALTPAERADLAAFLREAGRGSAPRLGGGFALGVLAAAGLLGLAFALVGGRRAHREAP